MIIKVFITLLVVLITGCSQSIGDYRESKVEDSGFGRIDILRIDIVEEIKDEEGVDSGKDIGLDVMDAGDDGYSYLSCDILRDARVIEYGDVMVLDGYEYPDYGEWDGGNVCGDVEEEKRFEEAWNIKINPYFFTPEVEYFPVFAYRNGKLYTIIWEGYDYYEGVTHFTVVNDKGEIEYYNRTAGHFSSPVVDDNGDVYFVTSDGKLIRYKYKDGNYSGYWIVASFVNEHDCALVPHYLVNPVIGRDRTVYAYLACYVWDYHPASEQKIYTKLVAARWGKVIWEKGKEEITGDKNHRIGLDEKYNNLMISPDDKLIVPVRIVCKDSKSSYTNIMSKKIYLDSEGNRVRETPWFKNMGGNMVYNSYDTYGFGKMIVNEKGEVIRKIDKDIGIYTGNSVSASNGDIISFINFEVEKGRRYECRRLFRINKDGEIIHTAEFPEGYLKCKNMTYLSNDGVMVLLEGDRMKNNKISFYVFDRELNLMWVEEKDRNPTIRSIWPFMLLGDCGKLFVYYTEFLANDDRELPPLVHYQFNISGGLGPGRSTWPMRFGDPQNTGRVQIFK